MGTLDSAVERRLAGLDLPLAVALPGGRRFGPARAAVTLRLARLSSLLHLATGQVGRVGEDYVEGRLDIDGALRDVVAIAAQMIGEDPTQVDAQAAPLVWWRELMRTVRSRRRHLPEADAQQVQFHYDVSDDFYALWLDPRRVYSCAYYRDASMRLAQAQEAKLDHICRKLMLREGERFLDIGAGWGGLLLWAAEHYGVRAHGITLSRHQHAHVNGLIESRGLRGRVSMQLLDYRELPEDEPFDKIASVGMFEHVGLAQLPQYFAKVHRLLRPGGLLMNHGITAGGTRNDRLGAGLDGLPHRFVRGCGWGGRSGSRRRRNHRRRNLGSRRGEGQRRARGRGHRSRPATGHPVPRRHPSRRRGRDTLRLQRQRRAAASRCRLKRHHDPRHPGPERRRADDERSAAEP